MPTNLRGVKRRLAQLLGVDIQKKCQPQIIDQTLGHDEVTEHRYLNCPFYNDCLQLVCLAQQGYTRLFSFSCARCPLYRYEEIVLDQDNEEAAAMVKSIKDTLSP